jgi:hypothetical protein
MASGGGPHALTGRRPPTPTGRPAPPCRQPRPAPARPAPPNCVSVCSPKLDNEKRQALLDLTLTRTDEDRRSMPYTKPSDQLPVKAIVERVEYLYASEILQSGLLHAATLTL